ncbi:MAG: nucleotidyltransferase domain-containing protein [Promethearchaeota archaeon]
MNGKETVHSIARIMKVLKREKEVCAAYVFGSYADYIQNTSSDIDIAILLFPKTHIEDFLDFVLDLRVKIAEKEPNINFDIVVANHAPSHLLLQILRFQPFFVKDPEWEAQFKSLHWRIGWDERYLARKYQYGVLKDLSEGKLG